MRNKDFLPGLNMPSNKNKNLMVTNNKIYVMNLTKFDRNKIKMLLCF